MRTDLHWLKPGAGILLTCLLGMHGCTPAYQGRHVPVEVHAHLPPAVELSETPFFPQTEHQCGPAALATVLHAHNPEATPESLEPQVYIPQRRGSLQVEMSAAARRYGMLPYTLEPALSDLLTEIAAGNPVLVLQNLRFDWWPQWHYAVVIGYDLAENELVLRSGKTERWRTTFTAFMNTWERADRWALVILPVDRIARTADKSTFLEAAYAFEQTGMNLLAAQAYRTATKQWPDDSTAWLMIGNLAYKTGNNTEAVSALLNASDLAPKSTVIRNNLAYALHANGCTEEALQSLQCARRLTPGDNNLHDSERDIRSMACGTRPTLWSAKSAI